jgi:hypothetical protein
MSVVGATSALAEEADRDIEAATGNGDKVILHADGLWEFVDAKKALEAKKVADQFPGNQGCPLGWQGGYLGLGRCISPSDKDFNRRSLSGK